MYIIGDISVRRPKGSDEPEITVEIRHNDTGILGGGDTMKLSLPMSVWYQLASEVNETVQLIHEDII